MNKRLTLHEAFGQARSDGNIDLILPPFLSAKLYVVGKQIPTEKSPVFFVQRSPNERQLCVTVSESGVVFQSLQDVVLIQMTGEQLLDVMNPSHEIMVVYENGGDYLTHEQLTWFRQLRREKV